jgi:hypothetical protein
MEYSCPIPVLKNPEMLGKGLVPSEDAESVLPIPKLLLPNPRYTILVRARDDRMWPVFGKGDLVGVDVSTGQLADRMVLAYHSRDEENWDAGIHIGWLRYLGNRDRQMALLEQMENRRGLEHWARDRGRSLDSEAPAGSPEPNKDLLPDLLGSPNWKIVGRVIFWIGSYVQIALREKTTSTEKPADSRKRGEK